MKFLFFDMEFANGQVGGSIYSIGYLITDENFEILTPPTDLLLNPECEWNAYVRENILAYPAEQVEAAPTFPEQAERIFSLFAETDLAIGFSVHNDNRALQKDCMRYGLQMPVYSYFDVEKLCLQMEEHREAHGLKGYSVAWCGKEPEHTHRSDGDAFATMELFRAVCRQKHVTPEMLFEVFPNCLGCTGKQPPKARPKHSRKRTDTKFRNGYSRKEYARQRSAAAVAIAHGEEEAEC